MSSKPMRDSKAKVSRKIAKVKRDSPALTNKQAAGKAFGILRSKHRKGKST